MPLQPTLEWALVPELLRLRVTFERVVGSHGLPGWHRFTGDELDRLAKRRQAILTWSRSHTTTPTIVFVGGFHRSQVGQTSPLTRELIASSQRLALSYVLSEAHDAAVIAVEQSGSDRPLTADSYGAISQQMIRDLEGSRVSVRKVQRMVMADEQATTKLIVRQNRPPVICGEEWPLVLASRLLMAIECLAPPSRAVARELLEAFHWLRSEIILIRTLEFLRRVQGHKGIILQGHRHGYHVATLIPVYRFAMTFMPTVPQP